MATTTDATTTWFSSALKSLTDWFLILWETVKTWVLDAVYSVFDAVLSFFQALVVAIPVPSEFTVPSLWSSFSPQTQWILGHLQITAVLGIIAAAWGVRFMLNLIPSWATRV